MIHVCSLARLYDTVTQTGASHMVTLLRLIDLVEPTDGMVVPADEHVSDLIAFALRWEQERPLVMHCYAGISRSTAGAFISACALNPGRDEAAIAKAIRSSSATAMPNAMLVGHADRILGRRGRMTAAIEALGPSVPATEGEPFRLNLE
jgi:predicted protein tyrosine phosphatase